jgi:hypothetical protein
VVQSSATGAAAAWGAGAYWGMPATVQGRGGYYITRENKTNFIEIGSATYGIL